MAAYDVERAFVAQFWNATDPEYRRGQENADDLAWQALRTVEPAMLEHEDLGRLFAILRIRFAEGEPTTTRDVIEDALHEQNAVPTETLNEVIGSEPTAQQLPYYARLIDQDHRRRDFLQVCEQATDALQNGAARKDGGRRLAGRMSLKLIEIYSRERGGGWIETKADLIDAGKARALAPEPAGITAPWPKLEKACGPWIPGEVVGISAFSNAGKSTFAANLFFGLARRGVPVIAFPTEMRTQWLDRAVAAVAGVPQWRAEKRRWKGAEDERDRFLRAWDEVAELDWMAVNRGNIGPAEIAAGVRVLRRRWAGRPVAVFVDHMHRLDYGAEDPNDCVGAATKAFKDIAGADQEGGLIFVLLYQPRKPGDTVYRPIAGHQIRGDSRVWNELDVHLSPFRAWVKVSETIETPWGTSKARLGPDGKPKIAAPESDGAKLDDEHVFVKVDKRRVGGEGPTVVLDFDPESGRVFELTDREPGEYHATG